MKNITEPDLGDFWKFVPMNQLKKINNESIACDYNRNLDFDAFYKDFKKKMKKRGMWKNDATTGVLLIPLFAHHHKGGEPCEEHMRCRISTAELFPPIIIDVPLPSMNRLLSVNEFEEVRG